MDTTPPLSDIKPVYPPASAPATELPAAQQTINILSLQTHIEGGYFIETDRDPLRVPNPFLKDTKPYRHQPGHATAQAVGDDSTRSASTSIFYYLTPGRPLGVFHRNRSRTVHTLHRGRGRYVIIHAGEVEEGAKARIETFVVGKNIAAGEKLQWIVEGGKFKGSYLLPDHEAGKDTEGLLISETVVPGFEYQDNDFMLPGTLEELLTPEQAKELAWMVKKA
ncbi:DUF985 domain-containing protein [Blastomyces gilchristii SLH14081]|uniref:DUF985 domain-containing protein n=1 Tax=Blastomyces gilchristii (strain SLH14081) TaxID=559298 RepID=A0A179UKF7_BLAGS|nr:DUF985 domain-containing protein [Blastomyces gilchristii SLH14081]OAT08454.1 DUF985 domain-containing protein [Blastomyces gilchristii SLH14081]